MSPIELSWTAKKKKGEKKKKKKEDNCISNSGPHLQSSKGGHIPPIWCRLLELLSKLEVEAISWTFNQI